MGNAPNKRTILNRDRAYHGNAANEHGEKGEVDGTHSVQHWHRIVRRGSMQRGKKKREGSHEERRSCKAEENLEGLVKTSSR